MRVSRQKIRVGTVDTSTALFLFQLYDAPPMRTLWDRKLSSPVALLFHVVDRVELFQVSKPSRKKSNRALWGQCNVTEWADEHKSKTSMMCQIQDNHMA
jgi:hypothetical protein